MVARLLWEQDAAGSNPVTRTKQEVTRLIGKSGRLLLFLYRNYHGNHADSDSAWKPRRVKKSALSLAPYRHILLKKWKYFHFLPIKLFFVSAIPAEKFYRHFVNYLQLTYREKKTSCTPFHTRGHLVRVTGVEPAASCSQSRRATICATPGYSICHANTMSWHLISIRYNKSIVKIFWLNFLCA